MTPFRLRTKSVRQKAGVSVRLEIPISQQVGVRLGPFWIAWQKHNVTFQCFLSSNQVTRFPSVFSGTTRLSHLGSLKESETLKKELLKIIKEAIKEVPSRDGVLRSPLPHS